jgi:hypothetical protein
MIGTQIICVVVICTLVITGCPLPAVADGPTEEEVQLALERLREDFQNQRRMKTGSSFFAGLALIAGGVGLAIAGNAHASDLQDLDDAGVDIGNDKRKWNIVQWSGVAAAVLGLASLLTAIPRERPPVPQDEEAVSVESPK